MAVKPIALAMLLLFLCTPPVLGSSEDYRTLVQPPLAPNPIVTPPPVPPTPPCTITPNGAGVTIDCNSAVDWAVGPASQWAGGQEAAATAWATDVQAWATVDFVAWTGAVPGHVGDVVVDEYAFSGPGTSASIHVHDDRPEPYHSQVTFVVKGGPGNARWVCQHQCTIPDTGFFVSIDPLDLSPNEHLSLAPSLPPVSGNIEATFS